MLLSPRGHTADSRELLMAVTGRTTLENAHSANVIELHKARASRLATECDLIQREAERDAYRHMAAMSRRHGVVDVKAAQKAAESVDRCDWCAPAGCVWPQCVDMPGTAGGPPTVPTRRARRLPNLPWWKRALLALFPFSTR